MTNADSQDVEVSHAGPLFQPGALYHVMNRGTARQPTFTDDRDCQAFLDTVAEAFRLWEIEVFAYSLMGNHYHLCLRTPKGNLSRVMRHVDGIYTQRFNRRHGRDGPLFRGRYRAILVDADEYLAAVVRYIHLNAVKAGMATMPEDYRWESHRYYYPGKGAPNWLNTGEVLEQIGKERPFTSLCFRGMRNPWSGITRRSDRFRYSAAKSSWSG